MATGEPTITLTLLGSFELRVAGELRGAGRDRALLSRKAQALLALLALQNGRPLAREAAVELLWEDPDAGRPCDSLRQTLVAIRQQVGTGLVRLACGYLTLRRAGTAVDVQQFEMLAGSADRADLARCAALYRGELLANVATVAPRFDEWLAIERIRLAAIAAEVMRGLAFSHVEAGAFDAAVATARRVVSLDELREDSHHLLISVLGRCGRRTEALRHYGLCEELLSPVAAEAEPVVMAMDAEATATLSRPGRWWLRGGLAVACLFVAMIGSVAVGPGPDKNLRLTIIPIAADTIGLVRLSGKALLRHRVPARPEPLPFW